MKESSIRPKKLLNEYIQLCKHDSMDCFSGKQFNKIKCVACGGDELSDLFSKEGFKYSLCNSCKSVFLNPRPDIEAFDQFYRSSDSAKYWSDVFLPAVAESRRELIMKPKAKRVGKICKFKKRDHFTIIDVGSGYGTFLEEFKSIFPNCKPIAIEPSKNLAIRCEKQGFKVLNNILEEVDIKYNLTGDIVVCFEVFEHVHDPIHFLTNLKRICKKGGLIIFTTLSIDGFDLRVLGSNSKQIHPPHHINFLSIKGFKSLLERLDLNDIKVTTPGLLDVDIVKNYFLENPSIKNSNPFIEKIVFDEKLSSSFQKFLVKNSLSSHAWVVCRT